LTLQMNVERIDRLAGPLAARPYEGSGAVAMFDAGEHGAFGVRRRLVGEIHPRMEPDIDAARNDPEGDMWRHQTPVDEGSAARLDRFEAIFAGDAVGRLAAPAGKGRIGLAALLPRTVVKPSGVCLPDFNQRVPERRAA